MLDTPAFDVHRTLSPLRRALGLRRATLWLLRGLACGAATGAIILLARHFFVFTAAAPLAICAIAVGTILATALAFLHWPDLPEAARTADRRFSLGDRLTTALEFRHSREPLVLLQRRDVAVRVAGLHLSSGASGMISRREQGGAVLAALFFAVALLLPAASHSHAVVARPAKPVLDSTRQAALKRLEAIRRSFTASLSPEQRRSTAAKNTKAALANLENQLKHARSQGQALRQISAAQARFVHIGMRLHPVSGTSGTGFTKAMHGYLTRQQNADAVKGGQHLDKAASEFLNHLAGSASGQTASQRLQTARALEKAAGSVKDAGLKSDLSRAATALGHNDVQTASQALRHAAQRFDNTPNQRTVKRRVDSARKNLDTVKNDVNGLHRKQTPQTNNGQNPPPNAPGTQMRGGNERGTSQGTSSNSSVKQAHGKGARGRGPTGENKRAIGGGAGHAGSAAGNPNAVVYVPGLASPGQHLLPIDLRSTPKRVPVVPYRRVIARYSRSARTSLERSPLPPSLQTYVRKYFTELSKS